MRIFLVLLGLSYVTIFIAVTTGLLRLIFSSNKVLSVIHKICNPTAIVLFLLLLIFTTRPTLLLWLKIIIISAFALLLLAGSVTPRFKKLKAVRLIHYALGCIIYIVIATLSFNRLLFVFS